MLLDEYGQLLPPTDVCYWHAAGVPEGCEHPVGECPGTAAIEQISGSEEPRALGGGQVKELSEITDLTSTGRKRAAMLYPIFPGMVCEWAGLARAVYSTDPSVDPMPGCDWNTIYPNTREGHGGDVHHGPMDKNTLANMPGNVHRICKSCHHTAHSLYDRYYGGKRPAGDVPWTPMVPLLHDPFTKATDDQLAEVRRTRSSSNQRASLETIAEVSATRVERRRVLLGDGAPTAGPLA